jgi:uncharacterized repeat protein (TIGR01451 family)
VTSRILVLALLAHSLALAAGQPGSQIPLFFIPSAGQGPESAKFVAKGSGLTAAFSPDRVAFRIAGTSLAMVFEGADPQCRVEGKERLAGRANFLQGAPQGWRTDVPMYGSVFYRELYPGIDMRYGSNGRNLKSEFIVAAEADLSDIQIRYAGASAVRIAADGSLVIRLEGEELREERPLAYQEHGGRRIPIEARYSLAPDGSVGFIVNGYDSSLPLIIDPVISYSTLLGGSSSDAAISLAVDAAGAVYVAGFTASYDFPTANPVQNVNGGGNDVFVAKLNPAGTALVYCTYLGGSGDDRAYGIAVDATGSAYVTGSTASKNFPVRNGLQTKLAGTRNAFLVKLNASGNALVFGTYLGGSGSDTAYGVAVDSTGNAYVVGDTTSPGFPANGVQKSYRGSQDAFVTKISSDGSRLVYSTFLGGSGTDHGSAIAIGGSGEAIATGSTFSADFPTANAYQPSNAGGQDAFVTRISTDGSSLIFSTYWGGSGGSASYPEAGQGIALDWQGNVYVTGMTSSPNFPMIQPQQSSLNGWVDGFVSKFNAAGWPVYSTYFGGSGTDVSNAIAVDSSGNAYVAGYTYSTDFPVVNALQTAVASAGDVDAFAGILNASGSAFTFLSYLGGTGGDTATAISLDPAGSMYLAGWTTSTNFPLLHQLQSTNGGNYGAFVVKMQQVALRITCTHTGSFTQNQSGTYSIVVSNPSLTTGSSGAVVVTDSVSSGLTLVSMAGTSWNCAGATCSRSDVLVPGGNYPPITVTVQVTPTASSPQQNTATMTGGGDLSARSAVDTTSILTGMTYTVSGHVTLPGAALPGVKISLAGGQTSSVTTDSLGAYSFANLPAGSSYTLTPSAANYSFTPAAQSIASLSASQSLDFTATANLAKGMTASQSSTYGSYVAGLAVDGNTDGAFGSGSISVASSALNAWWQVDLGSSAAIDTIAVWGRTDCCATWLSDYWLFVSDTPFTAGDTPATLQARAGTWSSHQTTAPNPLAAVAAGGVHGRYVRLQLSGTNYLEIAEVQVFGTTIVAPPANSNLAKGQAASQSSTYSTFTAGYAVDGNTDGSLAHGSVSATNTEANAWWQVDLGASATVSSVAIWGRTDCCTTWLSDYWIFISDTPFNATDKPATLQTRAGTWSSHQTSAPNPSSTITATGAQGRYVRIQLTGTNYLEMAEVHVLGTGNTGPSTYSISGQVVTGTGTGIAGLTVTLGGSQSGSTVTDASGNYAFTGLASGGSYTVTPSGGNYTFTPSSQTVNNLSANTTANFSAATAAASNLAQGKTATQSSTYATCAANLAVDGKTDGNYSHSSLSLTTADANAWWQVDLGASASVSSVVIWGRTDCCTSWLNDYWVFVSDTPFNSTDTPATLQARAGTWSSHQTTAPSPSASIVIAGAQGRYVRVQLSGTNYLEMAEVQVLGAWK